MKLIIKKNFYRSPTFWITLLIVFNCIYKSLINYLKFPEFINYFNDFICVLLLLYIIKKIQDGSFFRLTRSAGISVFFLLLVSIISYVLNLYSPLVFVWGIRTLFRFMIFYLACICCLDEQLIKKIMNLFFSLLIINSVLVTIQYFSGYNLDSAVGLFSSGKNIIGGSAGMNILMCIVSVYSIVSYMNKEYSFLKMIITLLICIYISALAEIKIYYFELVLIIVLVSIITKMSFKKILGICVIACVLFGGIELYNQYYGSGYYYTSRDVSFFSLEAITEYIGLDGSSYGKYNTLNRMTAIPYVWNNFLVTVPDKLFGLGVGYGDAVSSSIFSSGFLKEHSGLGYQFWSVSLELTNIGIIGLVACFFVYIKSYLECLRVKEIFKEYNTLMQTTQILSILFIFIMFYNQSLILDIAAPLMFFILSLPYAILNQKNGGKL